MCCRLLAVCTAVDSVDARPVSLLRMHSDATACLAWCADPSVGLTLVVHALCVGQVDRHA
eukprot:2815864-Alexandrium_andersonii.AAC.1